ncbi:MAG: hypothetical protein V1735_03170 [Nanoarchaeota archaeon]
MISVLTILLFFVYTWCFGYSITSFFKNAEDWYERNIMRLGIGLLVFIVVGILLNLLRIPLHFWIFLLLSLIVPIMHLMRKGFKLDIKKPDAIQVIVLIIFLLTLGMYLKGAFAYPWLEDDDPWTHAWGVSYVAAEKTLYEPIPGQEIYAYLDAYPPAYDFVMAMLHQTSPSVDWTLKFFNSLIISLSILFFFYFCVRFMGSRKRALFATIVLAMVPSYLSHFIWAHSFIPLSFFVIIYCLESVKQLDRRWMYPAGLAIAGMCMIQPTQPVKLGVMVMLYIALRSLLHKKLDIRLVAICFAGVLLSFMLWWGPMLIKYKSDFLTIGLGQTDEKLEGRVEYIGVLGSATRLYTFGDYFIAKPENMINNPVGLGMVICLLLLLILFWIAAHLKSYWNEKKLWVLIAVLWLLFTFAGLYGGTVLPIALESFQFWMLFAVATSILLAEGFMLLIAFGKKARIPAIAVIVILVVGIFFTSGYQKYKVNTAMWPPGGWLSMGPGAFASVLYMKEHFPVGTRVFSPRAAPFVAGVGMASCDWCGDVYGFRNVFENASATEITAFLRSNGYQYFFFDGSLFMLWYGQNKTAERLQELQKMGLPVVYQATYQNQPTPDIIFSVR